MKQIVTSEIHAELLKTAVPKNIKINIPFYEICSRNNLSTLMNEFSLNEVKNILSGLFEDAALKSGIPVNELVISGNFSHTSISGYRIENEQEFQERCKV